MTRRTANARINIKLLIVSLLIATAAGVSLVFARQALIDIRSEKALQAGLTAFEQEEWPEAVKNFRRYLSRNPDSVEILRKYATACLAIRPLGAAEVASAISVYNKIVELDTLDDVAYERLAGLYTGIGNFKGCSQSADASPNDH